MGQITLKAAKGRSYRIIVADREGNIEHHDIDRRAEERGVAGKLIDRIEIEKLKKKNKKREEAKNEDPFNSGESIS